MKQRKESQDSMNKTSLTKGNLALRENKYEEAIRHYVDVMLSTPELGKSIAGNLELAKKRYQAGRAVAERKRVGVCGWELSHNAAGRVYTLAMLYETFSDVEIIGSIFPGWGREVWEPIRDTSIAKHYFIVDDESRFLEQAIHLVAAHPYDIVHLSKPRAPNILFGILYKLIWDAKVLMDIDDDELAFVGEKTPISIDDYLRYYGKLPELGNLAGKDWTRLAVGLAKEFDGVTVCNSALQKRYGGEIVRHARDEKLYNPSPELKRKSREKYGIPQDKKVVLFFGTPREHKGLIETAQAIASLERPDILYLIAGDFPDQSLKTKLQQVKGCQTIFVANQPFGFIPQVVAIADCCVFLQDDGGVSKYQVPAKLTDALAMGVPVICSASTGIADFRCDSLIVVDVMDRVGEAIMACLDFTAPIAQAHSLVSRRYFKSSLSISSQVPTLCKLSSQYDSPIDRFAIFHAFLSGLSFGSFFDLLPKNVRHGRANSMLNLAGGVGDNFGDILDKGITARSGEARENRKKNDLGIIVLNLNGASLLNKLFESIDRNRPALSFRIFVTDHCSTDDSRTVIERWSKLLPLEVDYATENHSFSFSNNRWAERLFGYEKLLFLNNDIIFESNVLDRMARVLNDPSVGVVGIDQWEPVANGTERQWHHRGIGFNWDAQFQFWRPFNIRTYRPEDELAIRKVPAVTGSVMMVRRNDFLGIGGFDEGYIYGYEDVDLCLAFESKLRKRSVCVTSGDVIHADGVTRKKTPSCESKQQRLGNIELLRNKFTAQVTRMQRRLLVEEQPLAQSAPRVIFAVTEIGKDASAGDLFTAMELGQSLEREFGWCVDYRPRGEKWYDLADVDMVVAMVDAFDPRRIKGAHPGLIKIAWARNWFERWCDKDWHDEYDLYLASSQRSADYIAARIGQVPRVLRIAVNQQRFNVEGRTVVPGEDFVFTGSYWNADREVASALAALPKIIKGAIYGKNWEKVPQLASLSRGFVPYEMLPEVYRDAKIVIDDANHATKPWGSVNSRVFDALAAGCLVVTNSVLASEDVFEGALPVYSTPEQLVDLLKHYASDASSRQVLVDALRHRVLTEHTYTHRAYEFRAHLKDHFADALRFSIKTPVPKREVAAEWGDYHFAVSLARELRTLGNSVRIDFLPDWGRGDAEGDDVTLVLRGLSAYKPRPRQFNVLWLISHPEKVTDEELNTYERVFVASSSYAEKLLRRLHVPVGELLQCTDDQRFNQRAQATSDAPASDILFVGNSRNQFRKVVKDVLNVGINPTIYGTRWEQFVSSDLIKGQNIPNEKLAGYYANACIVLNDHWEDMSANGFLSNRLFDAAACGVTVISDHCDGVNKIFGESVITYDTASELAGIIQCVRRKANCDKSRVSAKIMSEHSFRARAKQILSHLPLG